MNISNEDASRLKEITDMYGKIHSELNTLESQLTNILDRKNKISVELVELRETEISLINKIEKENGKKVTQRDLMEILES